MAKPRALTDTEAKEVYKRFKQGTKVYALAAMYGVSESTVYDCGNSRDAYDWVAHAVLLEAQEAAVRQVTPVEASTERKGLGPSKATSCSLGAFGEGLKAIWERIKAWF